mmetsp:Transcript_69482/g.165666  ORF Transcript_69482/g.165666 Transcript_69482/m.165666 type:complete len:237 (+) Transcript_69482:290-1000(+)
MVAAAAGGGCPEAAAASTTLASRGRGAASARAECSPLRGPAGAFRVRAAPPLPRAGARARRAGAAGEGRGAPGGGARGREGEVCETGTAAPGIRGCNLPAGPSRDERAGQISQPPSRSPRGTAGHHQQPKDGFCARPLCRPTGAGAAEPRSTGVQCTGRGGSSRAGHRSRGAVDSPHRAGGCPSCCGGSAELRPRGPRGAPERLRTLATPCRGTGEAGGPAGPQHARLRDLHGDAD